MRTCAAFFAARVLWSCLIVNGLRDGTEQKKRDKKKRTEKNVHLQIRSLFGFRFQEPLISLIKTVEKHTFLSARNF
jgi:hypothetical protein